jgi:GNAT superfamily N-acetyltransferase
MSEREAERSGGGGYGIRYFGVSLTSRKRTAENFSGMYNGVTIYPVILKRDAKVIERTDLQDASDIEDIIVELYEQGVDAVWIGGGEEELVVINPFSVLLYKKGKEYHSVFGGFKSIPLSDEKIKEIYDSSLKLWENYSEEYKKKENKEERENYLRSLPPIQFEKGGEPQLNEEAQQYIDIISMNPKLEKYQKYKVILKDKFGIDFDSIYKDQEYIDNANLNDIKKQDDFLDFGNWLDYAKIISKKRGFIPMNLYDTPSNKYKLTDEIWSETSKKLNFYIKKVPYEERGTDSGDIARAFGNTIYYTDYADFYYFLHELGHIYDFQNKLQGIIKNPAYSPTNYGTNNGGETFAENFAIYFINPMALKNWNEDVYNAMDSEINEKYKNEINRIMPKKNDVTFEKGGDTKKIKFDIEEDDEEQRITISIKNIGEVILVVSYPEYEFLEDIGEDGLEELGVEEGDMIGKIEHLEIEDKYKGQGYAKLLMNKAIEIAKEKGLMPLYLNASPMGSDGLDIDALTIFYEKLGFQVFLEQGGNNLMILKETYNNGGLMKRRSRKRNQ